MSGDHSVSAETAEPDGKLSRHSQWSLVYSSLLAILLRSLCHFSTWHSLFDTPEFVTPWNAFKRIKEGVFLEEVARESNGSTHPHAGDMVHAAPILLHLLRPFLQSELLLRVQWIAFDLGTAYLIYCFAEAYSEKPSMTSSGKFPANTAAVSKRAFAIYLLNPMSIGCCALLSLVAPANFLIASALLFLIRGNLLLTIISLVLASQLNAYYAVLLVVPFVRFSNRRAQCFCASTGALVTFALLNLSLCHDSASMLTSTIGFFASAPDLTPNLGLFWYELSRYFFTQVFNHYRLLFLLIFQINALVVYAVPLASTLRNNPYLLFLCFLIETALFSPYPSYGETAFYLALIAAFVDVGKHLRYTLVVTCGYAVLFVLLPITWRMWVQTGSGNANFYFGMTLGYNIVQTLLFADLLSAYLRMSAQPAGEGAQGKPGRMKIVSLSIIGIFPIIAVR